MDETSTAPDDLPPARAADLPTARAAGCPFDPPPGLAPLRDREPLTRMAFPNGHHGWLATGHSVVRAVLSDPRFSHRNDLRHWPLADIGEGFPPRPGDMLHLDPPEHTRYRKLLAGKFTMRRMRRFTRIVRSITADRLDDMERRGGPVDLLEVFARPIPTLTVCELLGVPPADRHLLLRGPGAAPDTDTAADGDIGTLVDSVYVDVRGYFQQLVADKRAEPGDDLLSDLTRSDLSDDELAGLAATLLHAGVDSTSNMLALGTATLLEHPEQLAALREDASLADRAVEELMRYLSVVHTGSRGAVEDVELAGHLIRAGETVAFSVQAANRDPARFDDPDALDLRRAAVGHLSFGGGIHLCLGQQLARVEMRVAFPALFARFPGLRLAVPTGELATRHHQQIPYGVDRLPVTW